MLGRKIGLKTMVIILAGVLITCGLLYCLAAHDPVGALKKLPAVDIPPALFLLLMVCLPIVGFPITPFLVLAGVKFGILWGLLVTGLAMPVHLSAIYLIGHSFLRAKLLAYLGKRQYKVPEVPVSGKVVFTFVFAVVPSLPYTMKNYILAMSGLSFLCYLGATWAGQMIIAAPLVGVGGSAARMNGWLAALFALALLIGYWVFRKLGEKFQVRKS